MSKRDRDNFIVKCNNCDFTNTLSWFYEYAYSCEDSDFHVNEFVCPECGFQTYL